MSEQCPRARVEDPSRYQHHDDLHAIIERMKADLHHTVFCVSRVCKTCNAMMREFERQDGEQGRVSP